MCVDILRDTVGYPMFLLIDIQDPWIERKSMKKSDVFKAILAGASAFIPGGNAVKAGIEALVHRNDDPDDDVEEVADAITQIAVGSVQAAEGLSGKDFIDDPVFAQLVENLKGDVRLLQLVVTKRAGQ